MRHNIKKQENDIIENEVDFDVSDFRLFKKQKTINKGCKKLKQLKYNKNKVVERVIKNLKKQLGRKLTSDEIYSIKNYKGMNSRRFE